MFKLDDNCNNVIGLLEDLKLVVKKIKCVVIDFDELLVVCYDVKEKVGVFNLLDIFFVVIGQSIFELEKQFEGKMYGYLKGEVVEVVFGMLFELQECYYCFCNDEVFLQKVMKDGVEKVSVCVVEMLKVVYEVIGFVVKL